MGGYNGISRNEDVIVFDTVNETIEKKYATKNAPLSETMLMSRNNACATVSTNKVIALVTRGQYAFTQQSLIEYDMEKHTLSLIDSFR